MSLALEQPRLAPVQSCGCPRARDIFGTLRSSPEKTTCSFSYRFSGEIQESCLVPGNRDPKARYEKSEQCSEASLANSETGRTRFRRVRFQTPSSVSFLALTEFQRENSVSSPQPIICVCVKANSLIFPGTHRVFQRELSEFSLPKQYP